MDYTVRQLALYYREATAIDAERAAEAIVTTNLGFAGGRHAQSVVRDLRRR
jgi:hypothetical protein